MHLFPWLSVQALSSTTFLQNESARQALEDYKRVSTSWVKTFPHLAMTPYQAIQILLKPTTQDSSCEQL